MIRIWIVLLLSLGAANSRAQTPPQKSITDALREILASSEYQATESDIRSIELDFASRDLVLQPVLEVGAARVNENRQLFTQQQTPRPRINTDTIDATITKPFSTGTTLSFGPTWEHALSPSAALRERDTVYWEAALTQSLWRDGFGRSTRLRWAREDYELRRELAEALEKRGQFLLDFETVYWDWAVTLRSLELQDKNVKRSQQILRWVKDRYNRAAAESTDLLQAQALLTQKELEVARLRHGVTQSRTRIERFFSNRQWLPDPNDLQIARSTSSLINPWRWDDLGKATQLQYLVSNNDALAEEVRAKEARESIRPELNLELAYGKNAVDPEFDDALRRSYEEDHEYSRVGVVFRSGLDIWNERKKVVSARALSEAANLRRDARASEDAVAWTHLERELADLKTQIDRAQELVELQTKKANAERERYRKGRSTAFQAITFEQEAAEAEILLLNLYATTRKTEARARLFAR